eukprot:88058_1
MRDKTKNTNKIQHIIPCLMLLMVNTLLNYIMRVDINRNKLIITRFYGKHDFVVLKTKRVIELSQVIIDNVLNLGVYGLINIIKRLIGILNIFVIKYDIKDIYISYS